jgi:hypothetical protein
VEPEEDEEDDDAAPQLPSSPGFEMINTLIAQVVPIVINGLMSKKMNLASVVDWRRAHATGAQEKQAASVPALENATKTPATEATAPAQPLPPIDAKTMMHFVAIQSALKPDEAALAKQLAAELSPAEMRAWFDELSKLEVPQAVQKIRVLLAGNTEAVS